MTDAELAPWVALRRTLHRRPDASGDEGATAALLREVLAGLGPSDIVSGLGGHGLAAVYQGAAPGPTTLIRCELDGVPVAEQAGREWCSRHAGLSHPCGHDGHMAIVTAVAAALQRCGPRRGRVVLLYQPAEETGTGAAAVCADPQFARLRPDQAYALHNLPGVPLGEVRVRRGAFNCASRGMVIRLTGATSHAAHPEDGRSPAPAMCRLMAALVDLPAGQAGFALVTVVHARLGEVAFGTAPGEAVVMATLRADSDAGMDGLARRAEALARAVAQQAGLGVDIAWQDVFAASVNSVAGCEAVLRACRATGTPVSEPDAAYRWSEDFGAFTAAADGAMFVLGAGAACPPLHRADYDFPDELIGVGQRLMLALVAEHNGLLEPEDCR